VFLLVWQLLAAAREVGLRPPSRRFVSKRVRYLLPPDAEVRNGLLSTL
jgi:hypothetical protein